MTSTAGLVAAIPAMEMLGHRFSFFQLLAWSIAVGLVGLSFAVPLRLLIKSNSKLRFPTGQATGALIEDLFSETDRGAQKMERLKKFVILSGGFTMVMILFPALQSIALPTTLGLGAVAAWGFFLYPSPLLAGVGVLIGHRSGLAIALGTLLAWGLLAPYATHRGWLPDLPLTENPSLRGWILWPGIALMVSETLTSVVFSLMGFLFQRPQWRPNWRLFAGGVLSLPVWLSGFTATLLLMVTVSHFVFSIHPWLTLVAVMIAFLLAMISAQTLGETDFNPSGGLGKVTQLIFAGLVPGDISANLMAAGLTAAGARQSGDMLQDFKAGDILKANPRTQYISQCIGVCGGALIVVPLYFLFDSVYTLGGLEMPAPAAIAWKTMALATAGGFQGTPEGVLSVTLVGCGIGILCASAKQVDRLKPYTLSATALGMPFLVPPNFGVIVGLGALFHFGWSRLRPHNAGVYSYTLASGLILGEGLIALLMTLLRALKILLIES